MKTMTTRHLIVGALGLALLGGCEVTNPGPVQDEFLAEPASQQGLVNGSARRIAELLSNGGYTQALLAREIFPGGQTGASGHDPIVQGGAVLPGSFGGYFNDAHAGALHRRDRHQAVHRGRGARRDALSGPPLGRIRLPHPRRVVV